MYRQFIGNQWPTGVHDDVKMISPCTLDPHQSHIPSLVRHVIHRQFIAPPKPESLQHGLKG